MKPSMHGRNAQKILSSATLADIPTSLVSKITAVPGFLNSKVLMYLGSFSYDSSQSPNTIAMAFVLPSHAFLYETVKPALFFTLSTMEAIFHPGSSCTPQKMSQTTYSNEHYCIISKLFTFNLEFIRTYGNLCLNHVCNECRIKVAVIQTLHPM